MLKKTNFIYMKLALTSNVTFFKVWISYATNITYNTDVAYIFPQFIKCPLFYLLFFIWYQHLWFHITALFSTMHEKKHICLDFKFLVILLDFMH